MQLAGVDQKTWNDFELKKIWALILAIVLVVPNIWFAYIKWKVTLRIMGQDGDQNRTVQSFFAGVVMGMVTPNMMGNFIGRFYYFAKEHRPTITVLTLFSNYAQLLATLIFGIISVTAIGQLYFEENGDWLLLLLLGGSLFSFLIYFFADRLLRFFKNRINVYHSRELLKGNPLYRWEMIGYSMLRFVIFTLQFSLVIYSFGQEYSFELILSIWQVYLITLIIPSLFFGKLGVKEMAALAILSPLGMNEFSILFTSLIIWFVNSLTPALVGLIICKRPKA